MRNGNLRRVVVTGLGLLTPLGTGINYVWKNLVNGNSGIRTLKGRNGYNLVSSKVAGLVPEGEGNGEFDIKSVIFHPKEEERTCKFMNYGLHVAKQALKDSGWNPLAEAEKNVTGICFGSGIGGLGDGEGEIYAYWNEDDPVKKIRRVSPYFIIKSLINIGAGHISQKLGLKGPNHSVSTACTTGAHSIGDAMRFIQHGDAKVMLAGSSEASVTPLIVSAFSRVKALSTKYNDFPQKASRPFDNDRDGFVISEGAGCVVLEELEHAVSRNAKIYAEIVGYGLSSDAYHVTSPSPDGSGAYRCMQRAIESANLHVQDVDYVNAHATGTPLGDSVELNAISSLFHDISSLFVSSTKGSTGHLLGAAGTVEAIFTILSLYYNVIPPMINLDNPISSLNPKIILVGKKSLDLNTKHSVHRHFRSALTNSFGFGGTNASLLFKSFPP